MAIKDIYFVRHGETEANRQHKHQHFDEPLNEKGRKEATMVGQFLRLKSPDVLYTSPFARARETAELIQAVVDIPYTIVESVHEAVRPDFLYGKSHYSLATLHYLWLLFTHRSEDGWNNHGAENMFDVRNRVLDTKDMLMEEEGDKIAVVSHALFIDMFVHLVSREKPMTFWQFVHLMIFVKKIPNCGLVHMQFNTEPPEDGSSWQLIGIETT